jgi:hypothetical protein
MPIAAMIIGVEVVPMIVVTVIGMIIIAPMVVWMIITPVVIASVIIGPFDGWRIGRRSLQRPHAGCGLRKA